jgi:superfamily I DNA/RNA helicase
MFAVEGGAGCGKTFELMAALDRTLCEAPLLPGQRVLAVTFMHGAKHRLQERLRSVPALGGRFECATIDSFAWRLVRRWRGLRTALGIPPIGDEAYDAQCDAAAMLIERQEVRSWVAASFPIVLVDEAQDLKPQRLRIVAALREAVHLLVAADEFQCLDQQLRPNPLVAWLHQVCNPLILTEPRRTNVPALLAAAAALRAGQVPVSNGPFKILPSRGANMTPSLVSNAIGWRTPRNGNVAVITPARAGNFANNVVASVGQRASSKNNGPYHIQWERSENDDQQQQLANLTFDGALPLVEALAALDALGPSGAIRATKQWTTFQSRARGQTLFTRAELATVMVRENKMHRQRQAGLQHRFSAMTVQQAKNREFDGVVVLWPFQLGGDAEHKRRLLYNAITRARHWCTVILQGPDIGNAPPFA